MDAETVYLSLLGELTEPTPGIGNAFAPGQDCEKLYRQIFDAKCRLCDRLQEDENPDLECIINNFFSINRIMCLQMYRFGIEHTL